MSRAHGALALALALAFSHCPPKSSPALSCACVPPSLAPTSCQPVCLSAQLTRHACLVYTVPCFCLVSQNGLVLLPMFHFGTFLVPTNATPTDRSFSGLKHSWQHLQGFVSRLLTRQGRTLTFRMHMRDSIRRKRGAAYPNARSPQIDVQQFKPSASLGPTYIVP